MDGADTPDALPIAEAAERLGVTVEMLRKRAQRGTIPAHKRDGKWFVVVAEGAPEATARRPGQDGQDRTSRPGQDTGPSTPPVAISSAARSQLEAIRDEWLRPLIEQLNAKSEEIGRLRAERDAAVKAAEALREENAFLRAVQDRRSAPTTGQGGAIAAEQGVEASPGSGAQKGVQRSWWRFWRR